jgi:hypothetical protein
VPSGASASAGAALGLGALRRRLTGAAGSLSSALAAAVVAPSLPLAASVVA